MATQGVPLWSTTASSNATVDPGVNFAEGQAPSTVNNSARGLMASVANWRNDLYGITTGGTSTAYTVTTGSTFATAADMSGVVLCIVPNATNGASPTLAVDGLTARAINISTGVAVPTGALISGTPYLVKYVHASTEFILVGALGVQLLANLNIIGATQETTIATDDTIIIYDLSATANRRMLVSDFLKVINGLTEDTTPDGAADFVVTYDGSASAAKKVKLQNLPSSLPRGYIDGCILSNNGTDATNDIDISAGVCRDSTNAFDITVAAQSGAQLDADFNPAGTGIRKSSTSWGEGTWHIYSVVKADGTEHKYAHDSVTVSTVLTDVNAETNKSGADYLYARRISSILRSSTAIRAFTQVGDDFLLTTVVRDVNNTSSHVSAATATLTVPTGIKVIARVIVQSDSSNASHCVLVSSFDQTDTAPSLSGAPGATIQCGTGGNKDTVGPLEFRTNTSGQIRYRSNDSDVDTMIITVGWRDLRGKDD